MFCSNFEKKMETITIPSNSGGICVLLTSSIFPVGSALKSQGWAGDPRLAISPPATARTPVPHATQGQPLHGYELRHTTCHGGDGRAAGGHASTSPILLPLSLPINTTTN